MDGVPCGGNRPIVHFGCEDRAVEAAGAVKAGGRIQQENVDREYGAIAVVDDTEANPIALHSMTLALSCVASRRAIARWVTRFLAGKYAALRVRLQAPQLEFAVPLPIRAAVFACALLGAPPARPASLDEDIGAIAQEALTGGPLPGLSVAVVHASTPVFAKGYGEAEIENHVPATAASVYRINSITKAFTAIALLQLAETGRLQLDDPLSRFLPEFTRPGHDPTLRQLLNHSAGLVNYGGASFRKNIRLELDARQWVDSVNDEHLYAFVPGSDWAYSNVGYDIAGMVVEKAAQMPLAAYLQAHVFAAAGMAATQRCNTGAVVAQRASSYRRGADGWERAASWGTFGDASGRLCSSVQDLAAFWIALEAHKLIAPAALKSMRTRSTLANGTPFDYGLGTRLGHINRHPLLAHTGSGESWSSALVASPDHAWTVIVLANAEAPSCSAASVALRILRRAAGIAGTSDVERVLEPALARDLPGLWGTQDPAEMHVAGGQLLFKPAAAAVAPTPLRYLGQGRFRFGPDSPAPDVELRFDTRQRPFAAQVYDHGIFEQLHLKQPP